MSAVEEHSIENIIKVIGIGKFQVINLACILYVVIVSTLSASTFVFTARDTSYRCAVPECESDLQTFDQKWLSYAVPFQEGAPSKCDRYVAKNTTYLGVLPGYGLLNDTCEPGWFENTTRVLCDAWVYGEGDNIIKEFNIPCQNWKGSLVGTVNAAGQSISLLFSGYLSDKFGRRNVFIVMTTLAGIIGSAQAFSKNYWVFVLFEFLNLAITSGVYPLLFIMTVEMLSLKHRVPGCALLDLTLSLSSAMIGILAWLIPSWSFYLLVSNIPCLFVILGFLIIPESFKWLYAKGRNEDCVKVLKSAAKMNNITICFQSLSKLDTISNQTTYFNETESYGVDLNNSKKVKEIPTHFLLKNLNLWERISVCSFIWLANMFTFYGFTINSVNIQGLNDNIHLNFILVSLCGIPGTFIYMFALKYVGRKKFLFWCLFGCAMFSMLFSIIEKVDKTTAFVLYLIAQLCISMSISTTYLTTSELFPTAIRNTAMNTCSVVGRFGDMLAPQVSLLNKIYPSLPNIVFSVVAFSSALVVLLLPETKDKKMPDDLEEAMKNVRFLQ